MIKCTSAFLLLLITCAAAQAGSGAPREVLKIDQQSKNRTICGITFSAVQGFVVFAKPIRENSLRTRVDNERFNACPYNVEFAYQGLVIRLDFGSDITLERLKNIADEGALRTAFFRYDENGWEAAGDDITIQKTDIMVQERDKSFSVAGIVERRVVGSGKSDFCFSLDVIGEDRYVSGAVCRPKKNDLVRLKMLFSKESVIRFSE